MIKLKLLTNCRPSTDMEFDFKATIFYEDAYLLIVNKPAGMLVHPTVKEDGRTLYNYVGRYYAEQGLAHNIHPVSRLDRNTSGLVIFAKEPQIQFLLSKQEICKKYLAVVTGILPSNRGSIEAPIARKEGSIIERCVNQNGKYARTDYKLISRHKALSLLEVQLHTGRTHQIRVHMAYIGCPLCNDNLYGTPGPQSRHALHAFYLGFRHPVTDNFLEISCALPNDLLKIIYY